MAFRAKIRQGSLPHGLADIQRIGDHVYIEYIDDEHRDHREFRIDLNTIATIEYVRRTPSKHTAGVDEFDAEKLSTATYYYMDGSKCVTFGTPEDLETVKNHLTQD